LHPSSSPNSSRPSRWCSSAPARPLCGVRGGHELLGCAAAIVAVAAPLKSFAQQHPGKIPRIGWLVPTTQAEWESHLEEYRRGMREVDSTLRLDPGIGLF
jgi:hypothetical protein